MIRIDSLPGGPWIPRAGSWLLVIVGVVAIAIGAYLVLLDGKGTCNVPNATCPREYDTATMGILLGAAGVVALVATFAVRRLGRRLARVPRGRCGVHRHGVDVPR